MAIKDPKIDFRDKISTVTQKGSRQWIYALQPKGVYYNARTILSVLYLVIFFGLPFIKINGEPIFLMNIPEGKFVLFGTVFLPQDFALFGLAMLILIVFVVLFTLIYGRIFCGWMCPQTVFMEMVFRRIEYWIEGSASKQKRNDVTDHTTNHYIRKAIKHGLFFLISFLISNTFLAYIIGWDALKNIITSPIKEHLIGFVAILFFSLIFYFVFAFAREIICTVVCPYGRLQSVLLDKNSIVVAYDYLRGEPRQKHTKNRVADAGDCIDCDLCVQVCPTGIDIRNGTQMECTNCTACIDACNLMMSKINKPLHLIKYASENNIQKGEKVQFTYRIKIYTTALIALIGLFSYLLVSRKSLDITVLRVAGQLVQENPDGTMSNLYRMKVINKSAKPQLFTITIPESDARINLIGNAIDTLKGSDQKEYMFFINKQKSEIKARKEILKLKVDNGRQTFYYKIPFIGKY